MIPEVTVANPLDTLSAKHFAAIAEFYWGNDDDERAHRARYVRFESDVSVPLYIWTAAPELHVECDKQHGGVSDAVYNLQIRSDRLPISELLRPYAHSTVRVAIAECDPYNVAGTYRRMFYGSVVKSIRYRQGLTRLAQISVAGGKDTLSSMLGVPCLSTCAHVFGDFGCAGVKGPQWLENKAVNVLVTALNGTTITAPVQNTNVYQDQWWRFGELRFESLSLMIVRQIDAQTFITTRPAPPEWLNQTVRLYPGCDKKYQGDCQTKYANQSRFLGLGIKMPAYNPQLESLT